VLGTPECAVSHTRNVRMYDLAEILMLATGILLVVAIAFLF
jgi:hypothetical protein